MDFTLMKSFMDRLTEWRIPGNAVSVYYKNKEVFRYQSGYSDLETKTPMSGNEMFNIYSCSKITTVVAALQLYEKGFFLLTDPLYEYIPEYRDMFVDGKNGNRVKAKNSITLRDLFSMTAGLTYNTNTLAFEKAHKRTDGKMDTVTVARCIAEEALSFEPGTHWQYSLCHDVLAAVVEIISGMKFRDYVTENIFKPLHMNSSYYHITDDMGKRVASQYRFVEKNGASDDIAAFQKKNGSAEGSVINIGKKVSHVFGSEYDSGGAGIVTTVNDYVTLVNALANWGQGIGGEKILAKGTIELLRTNQLKEEMLYDFNWPQLAGYGYGLGVRTMIDRAKGGSNGSIGEFGWGGAAGATVLADPDLGIAMFYTHHMLNPQENYYQPRLRNVLYTCIGY